MEDDILKLHHDGRTFDQIKFWYPDLTWNKFTRMVKRGNQKEAKAKETRN